MTKNTVGYACEYCNGTVRPKLVAREVFKHKQGFVLLENVVVGICDECGNRYYSADILHTVHEIATSKSQAERIDLFDVGESDDLATEIAISRANQALMKFLDERGRQAQPGKGASLEEVRRQLGL